MHARLAFQATDATHCALAVIERDGKILTGLRNYTKAVWKDESVWTIPGGRCDVGETIEEALRREVVEEVGITELTIRDFIAETSGAEGSDVQHVHMFYCATEQDATLMEPEKFSEWRWVTREEYIADTKYSGFNIPAREMIVTYLRASRDSLFPNQP